MRAVQAASSQPAHLDKQLAVAARA
jgi:hypothetical protein